MEEEDGDRQEEEEEIESGEANQGECAMWMTMDGGENALRTWAMECEVWDNHNVHVRHASVVVNVVIGVQLCGLLVDVRVVPVLFVML